MSDNTPISRRKYLRLTGVAGTVALAGCSGDEINDADTPPGGENQQTTENNTQPTDETTEQPPEDETTTEPVDDSTPTFSFQVNQQNHGQFKQLTPSNVSIDWYENGINLSPHDAAKASPVPTEDGNVIVPGDTGEITSYTKDGQTNWASTTHQSARGIHATPVIVGGTAYVGAYDGAMYAFDIENGSLEWRTELGDSIGGSATYKDGSLYVPVEYADPSGAIFKLNATDGSIETVQEHPADHPHSTPGIDPENNLLAFGSNDGGLYVYSLPDLSFEYRFATGGAIKSPIAVHDGRAYFGSWDGNIYCVRLAEESTRWVAQTDNKIMCAPAIDPGSGLVFIGGHDGTMRALSLDSGQDRWRTPTQGVIYGSAVVCDDGVLFGNANGQLYALDKMTGDEKWSQSLGGHVTSAPLLQGGRVYVTTRRGRQSGRLYCLR